MKCTDNCRCPDCNTPLQESRGDYYCPRCTLARNNICTVKDHFNKAYAEYKKEDV